MQHTKTNSISKSIGYKTICSCFEDLLGEVVVVQYRGKEATGRFVADHGEFIELETKGGRRCFYRTHAVDAIFPVKTAGGEA